MNKLLQYGFLALATASFLVACDAHEDHEPAIDTSMHVGDVVCSDGTVMRLSDFKAQKKTANAVVFHVNEGSEGYPGKGYAVCLEDIESAEFSDSTGVKQGTSASLTEHDGNANTYALFKNSKILSPMAVIVSEFLTYGQSAYIPSVAQIQLLHSRKNIVNPFLKECGGSPIPDKPDDCWYWTSTEVEGQEQMKAWLYSVASGSMLETIKTQPHRVRPIITIW